MKKKLIVCVMTLGLLAGCGNIAKLKNGEEAVVKFKDGSMFSVDEVWKDVKDKYALQTVIEKIDTKILESEFKKKLKDADKYVESYEASLKANYVDENGNYDENALNNALTQYGYSSIDVLLKQQRLNYLTGLATTEYAKKQLAEKDIKNYYNTKTIGDIKAVHILVKVDESDSGADKKALDKANTIIETITNDTKNGMKTLDAFKKYEKDESVTYQDLGEFNRGEMVSEFEEAAIAMKEDSFSKSPVKTSYGYHIIYKISQKEKPKYEDAIDDIKETLANEYVSNNDKAEVNAMIELRKKYGVDIEDKDIKTSYDRYMNYLLNNK